MAFDINDSTLPAPTPASLLLADLLRSGEFEVQQLTQILEGTPGLAEDTLNFVNSPIFQPRRPHSDVHRLAVLLGGRTVAALSLATTIAQSYAKTGTQGLDQHHFWLRVMLCATTARLLCELDKSLPAEEAIIAASLQDIGMLAIDQLMPEFYTSANISGEDHTSVATRESDAFGIEHSQLSQSILEKWGLPAVICNATGLSHINEAPIKNDLTEQIGFIARLSSLAADLAFSANPDAILQRLHYHCLNELEWHSGQLTMQLHLFRSAYNELRPLADRMRIPGAVFQKAGQRLREALQPPRIENALKASDELPKPDKHKARDVSEVSESIDPITGLYNRHALTSLLQNELNRCEYDQQALAVFLVGIRHYSVIRECISEEDNVAFLQAIAQRVDRHCRRDDIVARITDADFVVVCPSAEAEACPAIGQRFISQIESAAADTENASPDIYSSYVCVPHERSQRGASVVLSELKQSLLS
ncbi:HDOD domain-containing protein [Spongiibacter marinus]|uniref:HDOD domain-containing protein n=1 Tax=Spongiibacter marinus TaxID=354246 RepID=UPI00041A9D2C|nr:HDOD domain-containing protein [Spongiibacter marinus]